MSDRNNIDKFFKEKSQNYTKEPPPEILANILNEVQPGRRRILPLVWRIAAGVAIIVGLGIAYDLLKDSSETQGFQYSENEILINEEGTSIGVEQRTNEIAREENELVISDEAMELSNEGSLEENKVSHNSDFAHLQEEEVELYEEDIIPVIEVIIPSAGFLSSLPTQIYPTQATKDIIPRKKYEIQYSWEDLHAFEDTYEKKKDRKILVSASMSPIYSYRDIVNSAESVSWYYNDFESGKISYSGGMKIGYKASKRLSIHTGLVYSRLGYTIDGISTVASLVQVDYAFISEKTSSDVAPMIIPNSIGSINTESLSSSQMSVSESTENRDASLDYFNSGALLDPSNINPLTDLSLDQIFHIMEVPFLMRYKLIDRKMDFNLLGGVSTNFLIGNRLTIQDGNEKTDIGETGSLNSINYSGNIGFGFEYDITKNLLFLLEPQFKYYLNSINEENLISNRPYSFGFYTGVSLKF